MAADFRSGKLDLARDQHPSRLSRCREGVKGYVFYRMATQVAAIPANDNLGLALKAGIGVLVIALVAVLYLLAH